MSRIGEGQKVSYIGSPEPGMLDIGDEGTVLDAGRNGSHVRWDTGARKGHIALVANSDLVVGTVANHAVTADTVGLVSFAVRETYENDGDTGVLKALAKAGCFEPKSLGAEVRQMIATRLRSDPAFAEVLGSLTPGEGENLLSVASMLALREALRSGGWRG